MIFNIALLMGLIYMMLYVGSHLIISLTNWEVLFVVYQVFALLVLGKFAFNIFEAIRMR